MQSSYSPVMQAMPTVMQIFGMKKVSFIISERDKAEICHLLVEIVQSQITSKTERRFSVFKSLGHGKPCRYDGEFKYLFSYEIEGVPDTKGSLRKAIVFKLIPVDKTFKLLDGSIGQPSSKDIEIGTTAVIALTEIRRKQDLFRRRLINVEKECRLTGIRDLRFLVASHIKPWSKCTSGNERTDGSNGLLLTPHADRLFDRGWITFESTGALVRSAYLPAEVVKRIRLNLKEGRRCGNFNGAQDSYLEFHRESIFNKRFTMLGDPIEDLFQSVPGC